MSMCLIHVSLSNLVMNSWSSNAHCLEVDHDHVGAESCIVSHAERGLESSTHRQVQYKMFTALTWERLGEELCMSSVRRDYLPYTEQK